MVDAKRRFPWNGMFLFLLGLLTGFVDQKFTNPRMGLAAHLEGVMNGTFLVVLGAIWHEVRLSPGLAAAAYWAALYGTYANWAVTTLAAIFGTAAMTPIAAMGHRSGLWQEALSRWASEAWRWPSSPARFLSCGAFEETPSPRLSSSICPLVQLGPPAALTKTPATGSASAANRHSARTRPLAKP
ncbi:hypothetical protein [Geothrix mesophila]|uniref:hypothetical protein n=1 Tax=Geothrix mesophila TaxID=2922723 RepID=UPI001FACFB4B|nr:hypothetical protein [Geothrix sp. SG198]